MQIFIIILTALLAAALGACIAILFQRRQQAPSATHIQELNAARENIAALHTELAVERERASRCAELQKELGSSTDRFLEVQHRNAEMERDLAVANEAAAGLRRNADGHQERIALLEQQLAGVEAERVQLKVMDAEKAAQLTERDAALSAQQHATSVAESRAHDASERAAKLSTELATTREALLHERKENDEKLKLVTEAQDALTNQFKVLANGLMSQHGETFAKQNKEQIDALLEPLRTKMNEFQQGLQNAHTESAKERTALGEQIKNLATVSSTMTSETTNLTRALKGKSQTQGVWGEMILSTLLEKSGLRDGQEYHKQTNQQNDDGRRLRPDVIVSLPGGDNVVIDSKVSLVSYEAHANAETDEERNLYLRKHIESLRAHIRTLSGKEYQSLGTGGLDYVVMFMPIEAAWSVAVSEDPELILFAAESNVAIATPPTLMMSLRTVHSLWRVERRNSNAEAIADRAGKLYSKFVSFVSDFTQIGSRLGQANQSYQDALSKLSTGPGNVVRQIEGLKEMGAKTSKAIPVALLGEEGAEPQGEELISEGHAA